MTSIVQIIQQRILHHGELEKLKKADDADPMTAFGNFATQFATFNTAKERQIPNPLHSTNESLNDLIEVDDNGAETRYRAKENKDELKDDEYKLTDSENEEENGSSDSENMNAEENDEN